MQNRSIPRQMKPLQSNLRVIWRSFCQMMLMIKRDAMLFCACAAPILAGLFFRLGIPALEQVLTTWLKKEEIMVSYYGLFDLFFVMLSPILFCFVAAMVVLEEKDDRIARYLAVTPLGKRGYLAARFGIPALLSFVVTLVLLPLFHLTSLSPAELLLLPLAGMLQGLIVSLLIVTIASNKLEGMAVTKLSTLTIVGIAIPYFVKGPVQYVLSPLPSLWIGKLLCSHQMIFLLPTLVLSLLWIYLLAHVFMKVRLCS